MQLLKNLYRELALKALSGIYDLLAAVFHPVVLTRDVQHWHCTPCWSGISSLLS